MNKVQEFISKNFLGLDLKALTSFIPGVGAMTGGNVPITFISDTMSEFINEGYVANDIVYSILTIAADKERIPPWAVYKIKDEGSLKLYESEMSRKDVDTKRALDLRTKALERYTGDGKLNQLLDWPNEHETFSDLVANSGITKRATGNRFIKATLLDMGSNKGKPQELHLLPSQHMTIVGSGTFPSRVIEYRMNLGEQLTFTREEVLHDKLFNPLYDITGQDLYGMAPLKALLRNLTRNKSNKIASVKSFDNLGPDNVLFNDDDRLSGDEALAQVKAVKQQIRQEYNGPANVKKTTISAYKMGLLRLGLSPVDLALIESEKWDVVMFANAFNFPYILLIPDSATYNNIENAEKALTTRCSLPYLCSFRNNFNRKLGTDWGYKGQGIYVDFDLSVYTELQKDMKSLTDWAMASWHLTPRMRYGLQQLEIPDGLKGDPMLDKIYVPTNLVELSTLDPDALNAQMDMVDQNNNAA